jgi:hypothetical protein
MKRFEINRDESWPVYSYEESSAGAEIPEDKLEWMERVTLEYSRVQDYLEELYG